MIMGVILSKESSADDDESLTMIGRMFLIVAEVLLTVDVLPMMGRNLSIVGEFL